MLTLNTCAIKNILRIKLRKILTFLSISILSIVSTIAQPVWVPTTPSIGTTGIFTIPINYGIDRAGTVYIVIKAF